jgi:hypothetical protein
MRVILLWVGSGLQFLRTGIAFCVQGSRSSQKLKTTPDPFSQIRAKIAIPQKERRL